MGRGNLYKRMVPPEAVECYFRQVVKVEFFGYAEVGRTW